MQGTIEEYYRINESKCIEEAKRFDRKINVYSILRLTFFAAFIVVFYQSLKHDLIWLSFSAVIIFAAFFAWLVSEQAKFRKRSDYFRSLSNVYLNELKSINRNADLYSDGSDFKDELHPYTSDLDIFGKGSLFEMLNRCSTEPGKSKLASWLSAPSSVSEIKERQELVNELDTRLSWKHHFQAVLLFSNSSSRDKVEELFRYLKVVQSEPGTFMRIYVEWIPWIFLATVTGIWFISFLSVFLLVLVIINLTLMQNYSSRIAKTDSMIGKMGKILEHFSEAIAAIRNEEWTSSLGSKLSSGIKDNSNEMLSAQIKRFSLLINHLTFGQTGAGAVLNAIMLWNIRQIFAIESWKKANHDNLIQAFDVIASFEALISLSSLRTNYPVWCFAELEEGEGYTFEAKGVGHPLIRNEQRISNDYHLSNEFKIDIITGSNMAGKSTFLRTLGINTVLALCGAPSCAVCLKISRMQVFTYMRIRDSLNESTSTFKAELDRLQSLLNILGTDRKIYFLIDEMLRGTNSVDKFLGSKAVIEKLISKGAVGIVATHDLQIAELEREYPHYIRNYHFDIQIDGEEMNFDYKLKSGECKTFNASILLRRIGIFNHD